MFNSYQELFQGFMEFYKTSLYEGPSSEAAEQGEAALQMTKAPLLKVREPDRCIGAALDERALQERSQSPENETGSCAPLGLSQMSLAVAGEKPWVGQQEHGANNAALVFQDPRLLIEGDGGKLVRLGSFNGLESGDLLHIVSVFLVLAIAKRLLSRQLARSKRIDQLGLRPKDRERIDESIWRLLYYSCSSIWLTYCCLKHDSHLLLTKQAGSNVSYSFQLDWPTYAIFMIQAAFYLHATYALVFEDVWRRDSPMMLLHHLAAVFATLGLYATRTHQVGLVSTVLRDTCDVLLEVTKLTKCLHIQHGRRVRSLGRAVNCFLSVFAFVFALNQLYYYPLFCLFHGLNMTKLYNIQTPVMVAILTCGLLFLLLDLLWFCLILRLMYYMALARPLQDLREYDDEDEDVIESDADSSSGGRGARAVDKEV